MTEPRELTIAGAAAEIHTGALSSVGLAVSCLDRIDELNGDLNAFIHLRPHDDVLADARRADDRRRKGGTLGPLDGIPVGLKANYACTGLVTSAGSRILGDWRPTRDAAAVTALRRAGAVILGMTNMHEFADGPTNDNPHYGRALNPHDPSRMPGGSSGGSAVALQTHMCLGATGSDDGGSIRIPAAFCGVVGLKPTYGLVSVEGIVPFSHSLDHAGPMARTPGDVLALLRAMTGDEVGGFAAPRPRRVAVTCADFFGRHFQPGVRRAFENAVEGLRSIGFEIRDVTLPRMHRAAAAVLTILFSEAAAIHHHYLETRLQEYGPDVRLSLLSGRLYSAVDYVNARETRAKLRQELDLVLEEADILVTPTAVLEPPRWDAPMIRTDEGEVELLEAIIRCTAPFNLTGHPAITVPCGTGDEGLPVGLQIVGPRNSEAMLVHVADTFSAARESA
ncbi:amidase [Georgenia sp. AZ-5]|uniref:amidase n=1 Tax=Georgenia sp. AZ-5 TaxID=3367526 RepID=UPI00375438F7